MLRLLRSWIPGAVLIAAVGSGPAAAAASLGPVGPAGASPAGPAVQVCGHGPAVVRPGSMVLTCADDGELAEHLHWLSWTGTRATATGTVTWRACAADCADSKYWDSTRADVTLTHPVREPGKRALFTRLGLHVTGPTPRGFLRRLVFNEAPAVSPAPQAQRPGVRPAAPRPAASSGEPGLCPDRGVLGRCRWPHRLRGQLHRRSGRRGDHRCGELLPAGDHPVGRGLLRRWRGPGGLGPVADHLRQLGAPVRHRLPAPGPVEQRGGGRLQVHRAAGSTSAAASPCSSWLSGSRPRSAGDGSLADDPYLDGASSRTRHRMITRYPVIIRCGVLNADASGALLTTVWP
jgi:hypothetical protein